MDTLPNRSQGYFENRLYRRICAMQKRKPGLPIISASGSRIPSFYRLTERLRIGKSLKTHPSEDLETALKTLESLSFVWKR
jgi:hypothetical protein